MHHLPLINSYKEYKEMDINSQNELNEVTDLHPSIESIVRQLCNLGVTLIVIGIALFFILILPQMIAPV